MLYVLGQPPRSDELVDLLAACHGRIRAFTRLALDLGERADVSGADAVEGLERVLRYFTQALPLHVADEEEGVLPLLRGRSAEVDAALWRMREEHARHDAPLRLLVEQARACRERPQDAGGRAVLSAVARRLWDELEPHLEAEERVVFPAIRALLSVDEQRSVVKDLRARRQPSPPAAAVLPPTGGTHERTPPMQGHPLPLHAEQLYPFDARGISKRFRHAAIFGALDSLRPGETLRFCNDHDPLPLLDQLRARYGVAVEISYVQRTAGEIVIDFAKKA